MNSSEPSPDKLLLLDELDEFVEMLRVGRAPIEVDEQVTKCLLRRGAMAAWALRNYGKGATSFLIGNYRLFDSLGEGNTYEVYRAQHLFTGRADIIKVLRRPADSPELHSRHLRTLRVQATIGSLRLVAFYDVGHTRQVDYAIVERVGGADLRARVRARGVLNMTTAAALTSEIATAVGDLHAIGLVHGNLQPKKVLMVEAQPSKLADVGFAVPAGMRPSRMSASSAAADFISPEGAADDEITPASDIYALGCILYYAVTGKVPFPGGGADDKRTGHATRYPIDPRRLAENLDDDFVGLIAAMMAKSPRERIPSSAEVVARLEPWCAKHAQQHNV